MLSSIRPRINIAWRRYRRSIVLGAALALGGMLAWTALALLVKGNNAVTRLDESLYRFAFGHALYDQANRPWMNEVMIWIGRIFSTLYVAIAVGILTLLWLRKHLAELAVILLVWGAGGILRIGLLNLVSRPRPPQQLIQTAFPNSSFPSGHATTTILILGVLSWVLWKRLRSRGARVLLLLDVILLTLLSGWSRLYLGVHWFSDVIGAWLLGGAWMALILGIATALGRARNP